MRSIKPLVISLAAIFVVCAAITGIFVVTQILPDIREYGYPGGSDAQEYNEQWTLPFSTGRSLSVDVSEIQVDIRAHDGDTVEAVFEGVRTPDSRGELPYIDAVEQGNGILIRARYSQQKIVFNMGLANSGMIRGNLTVLVPRARMGDFHVDTFSGGITVRDIDAANIALSASSGSIAVTNAVSSGGFTVNTFSGHQALDGITGVEMALEASSGRMNVTNLTARSLSIDQFSGDVDITTAQIEREATLKTSSGNITLTQFTTASLFTEQFSGRLDLDDVRLDEKGDLHTSSGNITGRNITMPDMKFNSFSGRVDITSLTSGNITGETSSGNVDLHLLTGADANIKTFSGHVNLILPENTGFRYAFDTFSGKNEVSLGGVSRSGGEMSGSVGDEKHSITVETSSGNISIRPIP